MPVVLDARRDTAGEIDDDATRRRFLHLIGAAGLALTGCASDDEPGATSTPTPSATAAYPVRVGHKYGVTVIESPPQRVVSIGFTDHDALLALGVVPVGIGGDASVPGQRSGVFGWAQDKLAGATPELLDYLELNAEAIAALKPDLIVGLTSGMTEQDYRRLSVLAPTVAQLQGFPDYFAPWPEVTRAAGQILGKAAEADELIAGIEDQYAQARAAHPEFAGRSLAYGGVLESGFYTENSRSPRVKLITALGFEVPAEIDDLAGPDESYAEVSEERLSLLDVDVLVWETPDPAQRKAVEDSPVYNKLAVARQGRDVFVDDELLANAMAFVSVLSVPTVIDGLVPKLAGAGAQSPSPLPTS